MLIAFRNVRVKTSLGGLYFQDCGWPTDRTYDRKAPWGAVLIFTSILWGTTAWYVQWLFVEFLSTIFALIVIV